MPYALCPMPYALCPIPYALFPIPYAQIDNFPPLYHILAIADNKLD